MLIAIAAMTSDHVIGKNNILPRHIPEDLKRFKELTNGHTVVMGRKTYESLPEAFRPLPGRHNIILSSTLSTIPLGPKEIPLGTRGEGGLKPNTSLEIISDIQKIIDKKNNSKENIFIIGGSQIYTTLLPYCDQLIITEVKGDYNGDAYFPEFEEQFTEISRESYDTHDFVIYNRHSEGNEESSQ